MAKQTKLFIQFQRERAIGRYRTRASIETVLAILAIKAIKEMSAIKAIAVCRLSAPPPIGFEGTVARSKMLVKGS